MDAPEVLRHAHRCDAIENPEGMVGDENDHAVGRDLGRPLAGDDPYSPSIRPNMGADDSRLLGTVSLRDWS